MWRGGIFRQEPIKAVNTEILTNEIARYRGRYQRHNSIVANTNYFCYVFIKLFVFFGGGESTFDPEITRVKLYRSLLVEGIL